MIICDACLERHREGRVGDPGPGALVSNATYWLPSYFAEQRVEPQQVSEAEFLMAGALCGQLDDVNLATG